jgi:hypothetical protein
VKIIKQCVCAKFVGLKIIQYIYDVSFLLMMSWCEVHMIYVVIKSMQLLWCNFAFNYAILMY